jgi:hypothetical protein
VFFSVLAEHRERVNGLRLLAANPNYGLECYDEYVRMPFDSNADGYITAKIREKIARTSVTVCLISPGPGT